MLVEQQTGGRNDSRQCSRPQFCYDVESDESREGCGVKYTRDRKCPPNPESSRQRKQAFAAIEFKVLTRVKHVEPGGPEKHHERQQQRYRAVERSAYRDPRACWSDRETPTQYKV